MQNLFTQLNHAVEGTWLIALTASLVWGVLSILLSPCHLASIPLVVAYVNRGQRLQTKKAFGLSCLFAFGIFFSILVIGLVTASLGRMLGDIGPWGKYLVAAVFMLFGLVLLEVISLPWSRPNMANRHQSGLGHCGVIVLVGTLGARLQTFLNWDQKAHLSARLRKICGAILILVGLYLLWKA